MRSPYEADRDPDEEQRELDYADAMDELERRMAEEEGSDDELEFLSFATDIAWWSSYAEKCGILLGDEDPDE